MKIIFSLFFLLMVLKAHPINPLLEPLYFPSYAQFLNLEPHFIIKKKRAYRPFQWGNTIIIKRHDLEERQSNQPSDIFRQNAEINVSSQMFLKGMSNASSRIALDSAAQ
ncbi:Plug domain-containing protein [Helicobacter pylori]|uniref:Plug domain-containing protein n=1 Tax=Helicobacter pylori TaxID=210 RepID=UPI000EABB675|nr:Plug domain-containing protein [Helicobacter pylori]MCQ2951676.1 Plug domain-containing protein [Helicobacter pylori]QEF34792.1 Plug domain-containing protein [Helicobacter pylori]RKV24058.1 iron-regulated protein [Helicobacter pylori]WQW46685.1 Plug domain-containing protein [Helicobacter pylori]WQY86892.1 Plug domain-containing protein [Helicobacter pylori]